MVTGAAGFLGGHVVRELRARRWEVTAVDDLSRGHAVATEAADHFARLDVRDRSALYALLSNKHTDAVVHLAGLHDPWRARRDPEVVTEVVVGGTAALLGAMRPANVRRFVLGSSLAVYGEVGAEVVTEDRAVAPGTPYARAIAAAEAVVADAAVAWRLHPWTLRLAELGGPFAAPVEGGYRSRRLVGRLMRAARKNRPQEPFVVEGRPGPDGAREAWVVDLLHVADAARAVGDALQGRRGPVLANVSRGVGVSVRTLVAELRSLAECDFPTVDGPLDPGEPLQLVASSARFHELTGWAPRESEPAEILRSAWRGP